MKRAVKVLQGLRRKAASNVDWLVVGLGNPGARYVGTRHNVGFEVLDLLASRWQLTKPARRYLGLLSTGRPLPGGPSVALLKPQTFMNEAGRCAGPARGALKVPLDRVVVVHDEIDLPFGQVRSRLGGGLAGHNGLRSLSAAFGGKEFWRVRVGVGRPNSTDPQIVSSYVLGRFSEPSSEVEALFAEAADTVTELLLSEESSVA